MPNMIDYLQWRGDLSLKEVPFCEPDNLVLSYLAYVNLDEVAPGWGEPFGSVEEISSAFFSRYTEKELKKDRSFIRMAPYVMKGMANTKRFAGARIGNYINQIDAANSLQFAAVEIRLEDGTSYIAFRGTDDTIVGWKEDFKLSNGVVPAQGKAVEYLERAAKGCPYPLRVGGHSKGGNLCIYASAKADRQVQDKILKIYSNDGPGFEQDFFEDTGYQEVKDKIIRIVPEYSVIGMLLEHEICPQIIGSSQKGIMQHDGMSWEIMGACFVKKEEISPKAAVFNEILGSWIKQMDKEKREVLIESLFSVLEATGAKTLTEIEKVNLKEFTLMLKKIENLDPDTKESVDCLVRNVFEHLKDLL